MEKTVLHKIRTTIFNRFLPKNVSRVLINLPLQMNKKVIEMILNKAFEQQITEGEFDFLTQRQFQIEIMDASLFIAISFQNGSLCCTHLSSVDCVSEATLSINTLDAIELVEQKIDPDTLFFQRKLKIKGSTELTHQIKNTIDTFDDKMIPSCLLKLMAFYRQQILPPSLSS